jgi:hypothetical protein
MAEKKYGESSTRVFHERMLSHPFLPGIGQVSGPADYYISDTNPSHLTKETLKIVPQLTQPGNSCFVVVEAKRSESIKDEGAAPQIFAQLLTLELSEEQYMAPWFVSDSHFLGKQTDTVGCSRMAIFGMCSLSNERRMAECYLPWQNSKRAKEKRTK